MNPKELKMQVRTLTQDHLPSEKVQIELDVELKEKSKTLAVPSFESIVILILIAREVLPFFPGFIKMIKGWFDLWPTGIVTVKYPSKNGSEVTVEIDNVRVKNIEKTVKEFLPDAENVITNDQGQWEALISSVFETEELPDENKKMTVNFDPDA